MAPALSPRTWPSPLVDVIATEYRASGRPTGGGNVVAVRRTLKHPAQSWPFVPRDDFERIEGMKARTDMAEAAARRRCAECGRWYMTPAQRDGHAAKLGHAALPADMARKTLATLPKDTEGVPRLIDD